MSAFNEQTDAFIENSNSTTAGIHRHCPRRRFVGGTSRYVCECSTSDVKDIRARCHGFTSPTCKGEPLPEADGRFPMTGRIEQLLDAGKEEEAKAYAKANQEEWLRKAKGGAIMNLSDLLASGEAFHAPRNRKGNK